MLSPSRLNDFLGCEYRTWLDLAPERGAARVERRPRSDSEILRQQGQRHEMDFLAALEQEGRDVVRIEHVGDRAPSASATEQAMRAGREVIHQACFLHDGWIGFADFLVRVDEPSDLGPFSYEVHDAKLAQHPKPNYIFQLLFYTDQVERIQGVRPTRMHLILGDGARPPFRPEEFDAYAAQVRAQFLRRRTELAEGSLPAYPYPVADCDFCDYWHHCRDRRRDEQHLSLVATLTRPQGLRIEDYGAHSVDDVASLPDDSKIPRLAPATLNGLRIQADLQVRSRELAVPLHVFRDKPQHGRGLARLPAPSDGDVFFDFEGDPYWGADGLEYLFGTLYQDDAGAWVHWPLWAHDLEAERASFETWMDWITERLSRYPDLHVFHFNHYEPTTLKRLMSTYGTREHEVDELLRRTVLVDLYTVVKQAVRVGTESYGLKAIEALYAFKRSPALTGGSGAARSYEDWITSRDPEILDRIAVYNRDDCESTRALLDWLRDVRAEAEAEFGISIDTLEPKPERELSDTTRERLERLAALHASLLGPDPDRVDPPRQLMADLLDYHAREAKPQWWTYFSRLEMSPEQLCDEDSEAIGNLEPSREMPRRQVRRSYEYPLAFPFQEWKVAAGDELIDPETEKGVNVTELDEEHRVLWLRRGMARDGEPLPRAIAPGQPLPTDAQRAAIVEVAERVRDVGTDPCGTFDAAVDLLLARRPRLRAGTPPLLAGPVDLAVVAEQVAGLENSALFIQGPPGSGKTYTGGRLAVELMRRGLRVGVSATAHKAIANLLEEIDEAADAAGVKFLGLQKCDPESDSAARSKRIEVMDHAGAVASSGPEVQLLAGTAWLWTRGDMRAKVDVLFIDEAGQVSLADAIAMATGARSIVLLGDPQQLAHVSQGSHPRASGVSVLRHLLGEHDTVPEGAGVFLDRTWRMHPDVCRFVSDTMYDGRLDPIAGLERHCIFSRGLSGAGLRLLSVEHTDRRQAAPEEAACIAEAFTALLADGQWTDRHGGTHPLTIDDILVVAPYNAQVRCLRKHLPEGARVGTVDKFQGQEAPVVFFSMTSSSGEDVPRGMDFLFSRNRLNVAVSRAQALAVVVCSPRLLWTRCGTVEQMRLVNMLCRFADSAGARPLI